MKDIIISGKRQKKELIIFFACFIIAEIVNAISIIIYDTDWSELLTQIGYVFCIALCLYLFSLLVRILLKGASHLLKKKD